MATCSCCMTAGSIGRRISAGGSKASRPPSSPARGSRTERPSRDSPDLYEVARRPDRADDRVQGRRRRAGRGMDRPARILRRRDLLREHGRDDGGGRAREATLPSDAGHGSTPRHAGDRGEHAGRLRRLSPRSSTPSASAAGRSPSLHALGVKVFMNVAQWEGYIQPVKYLANRLDPGDEAGFRPHRRAGDDDEETGGVVARWRGRGACHRPPSGDSGLSGRRTRSGNRKNRKKPFSVRRAPAPASTRLKTKMGTARDRIDTEAMTMAICSRASAKRK